MNLYDLHPDPKPVSAKPLFTKGEGTALSIHIAAGETLKEHVSKVPAVLVCIDGKAIYSETDGADTALSAGVYVHIAPDVKHAILASTHTRLLLIK